MTPEELELVREEARRAALAAIPRYLTQSNIKDLPPTADGQVLTFDSTTKKAGWETPTAVITDHGGLTGLTDDDHTIYRLESADHTHQSTGLQGGTLYQYKSPYIMTPQAAPGSNIVSGEGQFYARSGPIAETIVRCDTHFETQGTSIKVDIDYNSGSLTLDGASWTEALTMTHVAADGISLAKTSSFTNATIPANSMIRLSLPTVTGAWQNGYIMLETKWLVATS